MPRRRSAARTRRQRRALWLVALLVVVAGVVWSAGGFSTMEDLVTGGGPDGGGQAEGSQADDGAAVDVGRAREQLGALRVAGWDSTAGYSRERFPHWSQEDGCDTRDRVLERDGDDVTLEPDSCEVEDGSWYSSYDGETLTDPSEVDIDHTVPLANAWRTGAADWDEERREAFANDLERPQLIAVSASSNRAKGDQDPSQWLPRREYRCQYAHDWIAVKHHWELWVTEAERATLEDILDTCDEGGS